MTSDSGVERYRDFLAAFDRVTTSGAKDTMPQFRQSAQASSTDDRRAGDGCELIDDSQWWEAALAIQDQ